MTTNAAHSDVGVAVMWTPYCFLLMQCPSFWRLARTHLVGLLSHKVDQGFQPNLLQVHHTHDGHKSEAISASVHYASGGEQVEAIHIVIHTHHCAVQQHELVATLNLLSSVRVAQYVVDYKASNR